MRKFTYNKLVRDDILEHMLESGEQPVYRNLDQREYIEELGKKLVEEGAEISLTDSDELLGELADLQEVIDCLLAAINKTPKELESAQLRKNSKHGSFKKRIFIDSVAIPEDNQWIKYLESHPDRYPEITDTAN